MVVMKLLQYGKENGMFGHPAENTFALVSSICGFLNDEAYCSVVAQNSSSPSSQRHENNNGNLVLQPWVD